MKKALCLTRMLISEYLLGLALRVMPEGSPEWNLLALHIRCYFKASRSPNRAHTCEHHPV